MKLSVIIPFLNEQENIDELVAELSQYFSSQSRHDTEVIFVNDGSTDHSLQKLKAATHKGYNAKIISLSKNFGSHSALRAGIKHATGDYVTFMYADLQDPPELTHQLIEKRNTENLDIVWANRKTTKNAFFEQRFSNMYASLMKKFVSRNYPVKGFDIVLFNSKIKNALNENIETNSSVFLQILLMGFRQGNIEYEKKERKKGKSKWTFSKKVKLMIDSFIGFSYAPIRFVTAVGIILFFIGILFSGYLVIRKLMYNNLVSGWPMLISILTLGFGVTNISLGIIAEYLWRTLDSSRKRPVFIIDEIKEIKNNET